MKDEDPQSCAEKRLSSSLEKTFKQAMAPFEEFVHAEASSGLLLMACTIAALVIANTGWYSTYDAVLHTKISIGGGFFVLSYTLQHWINDGLMALFFFTVGLEIKREILVGELADRRQAILPIAAALGGMILPALIYVLLTGNSDAIDGWGIPMATDIAFAMGVLALLGKRVPRPLIGFLLALAIVDDLGAVLVIAAFYTEQINSLALLFAAGALLMLILANMAGIRHPLPYVIFGLLLWLGMLKSGIHATLAGVITALTVPANSSCEALPFSHQMRQLNSQFEALHEEKRHIMENGRQQKILQSMENFVHKMESPLQRMEHTLHIWVSFLIIPIFALANAGIAIDLSTLGVTLLHPVTLGVILGLMGGKLIGISLFSWLVIKMGWSRLPQGVSMAQIASAGLLAGIGFTMSIFIGGLAFDNAQYLLNAKIGILVASLGAGIIGYIALFFNTRKP
ncbi:MAG: Na+/H+ antiporter NhaA [Proteobacteria bacterium]|nr:Na+/H+ antiporter NhaA [Pseudomonadota bacterium]MBU1057360.1 Na+/H+ antiporter NhaA [Pseudomonadota bacterium]